MPLPFKKKKIKKKKLEIHLQKLLQLKVFKTTSNDIQHVKELKIILKITVIYFSLAREKVSF